MKAITLCVVTPLLLSYILCMLKYETSKPEIKMKKRWRHFRLSPGKKTKLTTVKRPTTTRRSIFGEFQWSPPTVYAQKAPDWWNLYETPQPPHRYPKQSFSYDLHEIYKDFRWGSQNPTPRPRNECTVKVFYDSYGKLRTMKKLDKYYVEAFRNVLHLDTNSYYGDPEYSSESDYEDYEPASRITTAKRKTTRATSTHRTTVRTTHKATIRRLPTTRTTNTKAKNTTHHTRRYQSWFSTKISTMPMKWILKITPVLEPEDKFYKKEEITEKTPHWGYLKTSGGNKTKRKYSYRMRPKTSPIKLIVVRQ